MKAPSIPMREVLAFSYAALQPSDALWDKYLTEIEKLEKDQSITQRDHQLLRSNPQTMSELMNLTFGDEKALTQQTIIDVLDNINNEIKYEENQKLVAEQYAHEQTQNTLETKTYELIKTRKKVYERADRYAKICAQLIFWGCITIVIIGALSGFWIEFDNPIPQWVNYIFTAISVIIGVFGAIWGTTIIQIRNLIHTHCRKWLINRDSMKYAIDMTEYDENNYK
jgi:hypothetical protein